MLTTVGIGGIEVVSLLDGVEDMDDPDILDPLHGPSDEVWDPYRTLYPAVFAAHGGWRPRVHGTILRSHGRTILVDTGVGDPTSPAMSWYPAPGKLLGSLAESGTGPGDVEVVVITYVHDDHIGGTVTAQGEPAFPNARYVVNRIDLEWLEALTRKTDEDRAVWDLLSRRLSRGGVLWWPTPYDASARSRFGSATGAVSAMPTVGRMRSAGDKARARALLDQERHRLDLLGRAVARDHDDAVAVSSPEDPVNKSVHRVAEEASEALGEQLRDRWGALERAEARLAAGTFGASVLSGRPIPDERLEAFPLAELTVEEAARSGT